MNNFVSLQHSLKFEKYCNAVIVFSQKIFKAKLTYTVAQCLKDTKLYGTNITFLFSSELYSDFRSAKEAL